MDNWTQDETGRSNSSKIFTMIQDDITRTIKGSAFDLIDGRADTVAGIILATLAHGDFKLKPTSAREQLITERNAELEDCLRWLLHLANGVSKGGGNPGPDEWEAAWDKAKELLND